jgi:hypothetical protein
MFMIFLMDKKTLLTIFLIISSFFYIFYISSNIVNAEVIFSEIMYNPEGSDSGREWVEVYNSGPESVDLSEYKLLENGTNHKISPKNEGENTVLAPNEYAIIADNVEKFAIDFPNLGGIILDSAFSLKNDGELLELVDPNGDSVDRVEYSPDWGANGTGNSLQIHENIWITADPTPNLANKTESEDESVDENNEDEGSGGSNNNSSESNSTHSSQEDLSDFNPKIDLKISIGRERQTLINSPVEFKLLHNQVNDENKPKNSGIKAIWSFGDGNSASGLSVKNIFYNTGEYNVLVTASKGGDQAVTRTKVYVTNPDINIQLVESGKHVDIMLKNSSKKEVNIGGFTLRAKESSFKIPKDTIISPQKSIILSHKTTELHNLDELGLFYPTGDVAFSFGMKEDLLKLLKISDETNKKALIDIINKL